MLLVVSETCRSSKTSTEARESNVNRWIHMDLLEVCATRGSWWKSIGVDRSSWKLPIPSTVEFSIYFHLRPWELPSLSIQASIYGHERLWKPPTTSMETSPYLHENVR